MDVIKVGIIGCGVISQTYIRDIRELYQESGGVRLELAACGDVDMEKAQELSLIHIYNANMALSLKHNRLFGSTCCCQDDKK